jgi:cyclophilin family peptidyl-prolyl cis-trans isomerase
MLTPVHVSVFTINSQLFDKYYFDRLDFRRGMPRFNPETGDFIGGMKSYYRSDSGPQCDYDYNAHTGDEQPLGYGDDASNEQSSSYGENKYPGADRQNNYYYKPRHRQPANPTSNNNYFSYKNSKLREKLFRR